MPTTDSALCREAIRRTLTQRAGGTPDANTVADATISIWHEVAVRIVPVIGVGGVDVLFNRSLYLTCMSFQWLTIVGDHRDSRALLANLKARLAGRETAAATEASYTPPFASPAPVFMSFPPRWCAALPGTSRLHPGRCAAKSG